MIHASHQNCTGLYMTTPVRTDAIPNSTVDVYASFCKGLYCPVAGGWGPKKK